MMWDVDEIKSTIAMSKAVFKKDYFLQQTGLKGKEQTSTVLHLEHSFVWCWNLDTSERSTEMPRKFWNAMLEKDEEGQLGRPIV
jgi:hypothetical protein